MSNVYDTANQLERELRETAEFKDLQQTYQNVLDDKAANELFKEFQALQMNLQQKQMQGAEFTEEDANNADAISKKVQENELIKVLMAKEQAFSMIINDLNRIIMGPVRDLYDNK